MVKGIIFDLDGVLVDADELHYVAFNYALVAHDQEPISPQEHASIYKGLPTTSKLHLLTERRGLPRSLFESIQTKKQERTRALIPQLIKPDPEKQDLLRRLSRRYAIGVCSNSIRTSIDSLLSHAGLLEWITTIVSCEEVASPKPSPDVFLEGMARLALLPHECLVVEDSTVGQRAAVASGAHLLRVRDPAAVNYYSVTNAIAEFSTPIVLVPAAGQGKRFTEAGYLYPKPLIDVRGVPMLARVLSNLAPLGDPVVLLQRDHCERYAADRVVRRFSPGATIVQVEGLTEGAANTTLLAEDVIDCSRELIIANSDQLLGSDLASFVSRMRALHADGGILTFQASDPKWSYAALGDDGFVTSVAEKRVISAHATVGVYYFRKGSAYCAAAREMIRNNIRVNGEFYVCPVFNELIARGARVAIQEISPSHMHGLGTPDDLARYLAVTQPPTEVIELDRKTIFDVRSGCER